MAACSVATTAVLGYGLKYSKFSFVPFVLGTILGYMIQSSYRRALLMVALGGQSAHDFGRAGFRPIS
jgi:TctA family transporter